MIEKVIALLIIAILGFLVLRYKYLEYNKSRKLRKRFQRGNELEKEAGLFLEDKGYTILKEQYACYHTYKVDGEEQQSKLIVDYVVGRKGKTYLVEVKSGQQAIFIKNKNTRRQLLEYDFAIKNDGIFLLDMENEQLYEISFSNAKKIKNYRLTKLTILLAVGVMFLPFMIVKVIAVLIFILLWFYPAFFEKIVD